MTAVDPAGPRIVLGLVPSLGSSFWNVMVAAIEETLLAAGYGVVFGDTRHDPARELHFEQFLRSGHVVGLILFNPSAASAPRLFGAGVPAVCVYGDMALPPDVPEFGIANRVAAAEVVGHLVRLGHRRIAHAAGPENSNDGRERLRGYADGLAAADIPFDPALVWPGSFAVVAGTRAAQRYFAMADRPTAVFAASDEVAIGLIAGLREGGVDVPGQVSVAGFDGTELSAVYEPALTTMLQPRAELGRLAAQSLVRRLAGASGEEAPVCLPCRLVVRQSTAPPPAASWPPRGAAGA